MSGPLGASIRVHPFQHVRQHGRDEGYTYEHEPPKDSEMNVQR